MIKALRITSVLAVVLAVVFFVLPAVFGIRGDERAEQFLGSAGEIENFKKAKGQEVAKSESQVSPLVKAAGAFALYLNPPKPKAPPRRPSREGSAPRPHASVSAKFNLVGTSYYALRPELSLALIDEPGKGFHWVRQSGQVGHLIVEQIKEGLVVVRDGKRKYELEVERPKKISLLKGSVSDVRITSTKPSPKSRDEKEEQRKMLEEGDETYEGEVVNEMERRLREEIEAARAGEDLDEVKKLERLMDDIESMRISDDEARRLGRLGERLRERRRDGSRGREGKLEVDANLSEPNLIVADANDVNRAEANGPE